MKIRLCNFTVRAFDESDPLDITFQEVRDPSRVRRFVASDDTIDRYGDVILASGIDLTNYAKAPRVQAFHDYNMWPLGKSVAGGVRDGALLLDIEFDPPEIDEAADQVLAKIDYGTVSTGSVGFIPKTVLRPGDSMDEGQKSLFARYPGVNRIYTQSELLEFSIVPIPANPNAVAAAYRKFAEQMDKQIGSLTDAAPEGNGTVVGAEEEQWKAFEQKLDKMKENGNG